MTTDWRQSPSEASAPEGEAETLRARVEEVRDYLVAVRGGAPFLSPEDERRLLGWLDQGRSPLEILAAIDETANRRRRRKLRSRLTLQACARLLDPAVRPTSSGGPSGGLSRLIASWRALPLPAGERALLDTLCAALEPLVGLAVHPDEAGRAAARAIAAFHRDRWLLHQDRWEALRAQARAHLVGLDLTPEDLDELVEEQAHDLLRRELPDVSARRLWDTLRA